MTSDETAIAHTTFVLGAAAVFDGDLVAGATLMEEAHNRHRRLGTLDSNVTMTRVGLAITLAFEGDWTRAESLCVEAKTICRASTPSP